MQNESLFFPLLSRRKQYTKTRNGRYYADYTMYKQEIREDCLGRCVYCDSHENETGGAESMDLDHFRPKKYAEFAHLTNDPHNLLWACRGCNRLKGPHWPALGTPHTAKGKEGFIDPFAHNRLDYLKVLLSGDLVAIKPPADYQIKLLSLNRPSKTRLRELRLIKKSWIKGFLNDANTLQHVVDTETNLSRAGKANLEHIISLLTTKAEELSVVFFDFSLH